MADQGKAKVGSLGFGVGDRDIDFDLTDDGVTITVKQSAALGDIGVRRMSFALGMPEVANLARQLRDWSTSETPARGSASLGGKGGSRPEESSGLVFLKPEPAPYGELRMSPGFKTAVSYLQLTDADDAVAELEAALGWIRRLRALVTVASPSHDPAARPSEGRTPPSSPPAGA